MLSKLLRCLVEALVAPFCCLGAYIYAICNPNAPIPSNTFYQDGDLVVHERQSLQLCAIHTVNNLLQLTFEETCVAWVCDSTPLELTEEQRQPCTREEMNELADHLTSTESALLSDDMPSDLEVALMDSTGSTTRRKATCAQRLCSNHRSVLFGNYSFETLQLALEKRKVELQWYQPDSNFLQCPEQEEEGGIVIGFIINAVEQREESRFAKWPVIGCCFERARHWYSISRIRRVPEETDGGPQERWKILDSNKNTVPILQSETILQHLTNVVEADGSIFRAIMKA